MTRNVLYKPSCSLQDWMLSDQIRCVQYLFPQFIMLLQEPQSSGLKTSQQDLQFLLQFSCSSSFCRHVTAVHLKESGGIQGSQVWTRTVLKPSSFMRTVSPLISSPGFQYDLSLMPGLPWCICSDQGDTTPVQRDKHQLFLTLCSFYYVHIKDTSTNSVLFAWYFAESTSLVVRWDETCNQRSSLQ